METIIGEMLQTLYAVWVTAFPLIPWRLWVVLGACVFTVMAFRDYYAGRITRLNAGSRFIFVKQDAVRQGSNSGSTAGFLHRNYCLHMSALFAALGADQMGGLLLLGAGAAIDAVREQKVTRPLLDRQSSSWLPEGLGSVTTHMNQWTPRQTLYGWTVCISAFLLLFWASSTVATVRSDFIDLLDMIRHLQKEMIPSVFATARNSSSNDLAVSDVRIGLMQSSGLIFVLTVIFLVTWKTTAFFFRAPYSSLLMSSPIGITILAAVCILLLYLSVIKDPSLHSKSVHMRGISIDVMYRIFAQYIGIGVCGWLYYVIITTMRTRDKQPEIAK